MYPVFRGLRSRCKAMWERPEPETRVLRLQNPKPAFDTERWVYKPHNRGLVRSLGARTCQPPEIILSTLLLVPFSCPITVAVKADKKTQLP